MDHAWYMVIIVMFVLRYKIQQNWSESLALIFIKKKKTHFHSYIYACIVFLF